MNRMANPRIVPLAWYRDASEEQERVLGSDPWEYGLTERNRKVLETLVGYSHEQGLIRSGRRSSNSFSALIRGARRRRVSHLGMEESSFSSKVAPLAIVLSCGICTAQAQDKVWKHGILEAKSDAGFIAMVDKGGFAAKRGLKVEILQIKAGATLMKALVSGEIDSVDMGAAELIVAGVRGTGVKIVGCTWPGVPQVVLAKAEINTLADLKGKTVAISSPGSLPDLLFRGMLDAANVPFADVKLATQGADLDRYKSLVAGITDAAVVSNEFEAVMPPNVKVLAKGGSSVPKFIRLCVATSSKVLAERRDDLVKFIAAEMDAYKYAAAHRDDGQSGS